MDCGNSIRRHKGVYIHLPQFRRTTSSAQSRRRPHQRRGNETRWDDIMQPDYHPTGVPCPKNPGRIFRPRRCLERSQSRQIATPDQVRIVRSLDQLNLRNSTPLRVRTPERIAELALQLRVPRPHEVEHHGGSEEIGGHDLVPRERLQIAIHAQHRRQSVETEFEGDEDDQKTSQDSRRASRRMDDHRHQDSDDRERDVVEYRVNADVQPRRVRHVKAQDADQSPAQNPRGKERMPGDHIHYEEPCYDNRRAQESR